jgi:VanZ family protein
LSAVLRVLGQVLAICLALWVLNTLPMPSDAVIWHAIYDAGHGPLFGVIAWSILSMLRVLMPAGSLRRVYAAAFTITAVLGALTEFLQLFSTRDADILDLMRNLAGAGAVLLVRGALERSSTGRPRLEPVSKRIAAWVAAVVLMAGVFTPVAMTLRAYQEQTRRFPVLAEFDSWWEPTFVLATRAWLEPEALPDRFGEAGRKVGRWILYPREWPGLRIVEPVQDWSDRKAIRFEIWSGLDDELPMTLLVDDFHRRDHRQDRSRTRFVVHPGYNDIRISLEEVRTDPKDRLLDMDQIGALYLYTTQPDKTLTIWIDSIRLE